MSNADVISGSVMLILTSTNNSLCPALSDTMFITVEPLPVAAFSSSSGDTLDVTFTDQSTGATAWYWTFGDGWADYGQAPARHSYSDHGPYTVTLTTTNGSCSATISQQVSP